MSSFESDDWRIKNPIGPVTAGTLKIFSVLDFSKI